MKTTNIDLAWHPQVKRWSCDWYYVLTTSHQFTGVSLIATGKGRGILTAMFSAWWKARRFSRLNRAKPGEREVKGWSA